MTSSEFSILPERVASKIQVTDSGCWRWTGYVNKAGYGAASDRKPDGGHRKNLVHRMVWTALVGPIPDGMELDHLCHTQDLTCRAGDACMHRRCVNPSHLEAVTRDENNRRSRGLVFDAALKTHCPQGHALSGDNLATIKGKSHRVCRTCANASTRRSAQAKRARELAMTDAERMAAWRESQARKRST